MQYTEEDNEELYEHYKFTVDKKQSPLRIDKFLLDRIPNVSRNKIQSGIKDGFVTVNDALVKANYKVQAEDEIVIQLPEPPRDTTVIPQDIDLDIVFEDDYLLVVNKPAGMVVHPAYNNWEGTLVNALAWHFQQLPTLPGNTGRPGLVHRIDKDTSGLLVIAKTEAAMTSLAKQFFDHITERSYYALVWGEPNPPDGTIDVNLGRSPKDRRVVTAYEEGGKTAITHYKTLQSLRYVSLLQCNLETGRTHQIRAHLKHAGYPLFNDSSYGGDKILKGTTFSKYRSFVNNCFKILPRQALHAKTLGFRHPGTGEWKQFDTDLPPDFHALLEKWERYVQYID